MSRNDLLPRGQGTPQPLRTELLSRRGILRAAGGVGLAGALGAASARSADAAGRRHGVRTPALAAAPSVWTHPGALHNRGDMIRARIRVAAGIDPWYADWQVLTANAHSASTWTANPQQTVYRGGSHPQNYPILYCQRW
ncbi:hypothetical protein [Streptomyces gilvifuscus]|uniref:hypothetical protein n=1 Tax=Streptomyces gilvifuscus TaxID=1550617 RepID=UPI002FEE2F5B